MAAVITTSEDYSTPTTFLDHRCLRLRGTPAPPLAGSAMHGRRVREFAAGTSLPLPIAAELQPSIVAVALTSDFQLAAGGHLCPFCFSRFDAIPACDKPTAGLTDRHRAIRMHRAINRSRGSGIWHM